MRMEQVIKAANPKADALLWFPLLEAAAMEFGITGEEEQAAFLANAAHETGGFVKFVESLNYRWDALLDQWGNRFTPQQAVQYGRVDDSMSLRTNGGVIWRGTLFKTSHHAANQEAIANIAYGGRFGNSRPTDGWKFRGRGMFQFTFSDNYRAYSEAVDLPLIMEQPELLSEPEHAARSAGFYWKWKGLGDKLKDRGFTAVRVAVNGGKIGLKEATQLYHDLC